MTLLLHAKNHLQLTRHFWDLAFRTNNSHSQYTSATLSVQLQVIYWIIFCFVTFFLCNISFDKQNFVSSMLESLLSNILSRINWVTNCKDSKCLFIDYLLVKQSVRLSVVNLTNVPKIQRLTFIKNWSIIKKGYHCIYFNPSNLFKLGAAKNIGSVQTFH